GLGLRLRKVNGIYDRGRTASNRIEAQHVANAVIDHARQYGHAAAYPGGMSLAVGTFSVTQRDAILDELELLRRTHPEHERFFDPNAPEPFFVKNLEAIQGDERDVVFISVGYGPDADGYKTMGFGPLSQEGGERRLNVLITRARRRCEVFSSMTAADIDLSRAKGVGSRVLKTFLQYAETGKLDRSDVGKRAIDSDFEEDVGNALAALGYQVEHQVGVAGFFVDLAIKDPERRGRYLLGIECDGLTYHSSRSARDRDRLREQVLKNRGWRIHRIWSIDWFKRRNQELQRAIAAIIAAQASAPLRDPNLGIGAAGAQTGGGTPGKVPPQKQPSPEPPATGGNPYVEADFEERVDVDPHLVPISRRMDIVVRIVEAEGPIHHEEIGRRYATVCGKERAGMRIQQAVRQALVRARREGRLHADGPFYTLSPVKECPPRDRSNARSLNVRANLLPPIEIRTGLRQVVRDHIGVETDEAIVETARMLGFLRTGSELREVIENELRQMLADGDCILRDRKVYERNE
ncbi:MAG: DUF3320 domain-containing protein, partial [Longimicrobiales bacterium]